MSLSSNDARPRAQVVLEPTVVCGEGETAILGAVRPARLIVVSGSSAGTSIALSGEETAVGRAMTNDVVLPDVSVSRRHALFRRKGDGYVVVDRGSGNGTRLNGRSIQAARVRNGDEIALGDAVVQFVAEGEVAARGRRPVRGVAEVLRRSSFVDPQARGRLRIGIGAAVPFVMLLGATALVESRGAHRAGEIARRDSSTGKVAAGPDSSAPRSDFEASLAPERPAATSGTPPQDTGKGAPVRRVVASPSATAARIRRAYAAGDLASAIALARTTASSRSLVTHLETVSSAWREAVARAGEHRPAEAISALDRAEAADAAIGAPKDGSFSRKIRKALADLHGQMGSAELAGGRLASAATHLRAALRYDPGNERVRDELQRILALADDAYLRGYVAKDIDEEGAREAFRTAVAVLPPGDPTAEKARRWLERLDGKAAEED